MKDHHSNNTAEELKKNLQAHPRATRVIFCTLVLLVLALFLLCTVSLVLVFFSVDVIEVYGESRYSSEELILSSGIEKGDRLYYLGAEKKEKALLQKYPYLKSVEIKGYFPNKAVIEVEDFDTTYIAKHELGYCYLNEDLMILEIAETAPTLSETDSIYLDFQSSFSGGVGEDGICEEKDFIKEICDCLKNFEHFDKLDKICGKDKHSISFVFAESCKIVLGNTQNTDEKIKLALQIYNSSDFDRESCSVIDVSNEKKVVLRYVTKEDFQK